MSGAEERRSFLLSMTLTELALILFFLLLLLAALELERSQDQAREIAERMSRMASAFGFDASEEDFDHLVRRIDQMRMENEGLSDKLSTCRTDLQHARWGYGPPPCWENPDTHKVEYIYRVVITEEDLEVQRAWPRHRENDIERIPNARALLGKEVPPGKFAKLAPPLLEWSKSQDPACRLYVRIADEAETKDAYKERRLLIEDFFYKFEERR